jgi:hypothetical protein
MAGAVASLPEQGQQVSVRSRRWVVGEVNKSTLPPPQLEPVPAQAQHLVSLTILSKRTAPWAGRSKGE